MSSAWRWRSKAYLASRWLYRRSGRYLLSPLILVPVLLLAVAVPLHTAYAEYGVGAHGAGVSRAQEVGCEEGSVAGLVMVLTGLLNLFAAPLLAMLL